MEENGPRTLQFHLQQVKEGKRRHENAFQTVAWMILENNEHIERIMVNGKSTYNFKIFRVGNKHVIGMYDEINSFVSCIKDAAEGGSSREMAFVLVGEPGNGKIFFVDTLCHLYRNFLAQGGNRRYTFNIKNLEKLGTYGRIAATQSQTFEDPMVLAMNFFPTREENGTYRVEDV